MRIVRAGPICVGAVCYLSTAAAQGTKRATASAPRQIAITHVAVIDVVNGGLLELDRKA